MKKKQVPPPNLLFFRFLFKRRETLEFMVGHERRESYIIGYKIGSECGNVRTWNWLTGGYLIGFIFLLK